MRMSSDGAGDGDRLRQRPNGTPTLLMGAWARFEVRDLVDSFAVSLERGEERLMCLRMIDGGLSTE